MRAHDEEDAPPIWAAISDLMACLFGLFVLFFVWMVMTQVVLGHDLESERASLAQTRAELSAQRALTVTRALIEAGLPGDSLIAAGFGEHHPVAPNASDEQRAQNRRVEIAPVPRPGSFHAHAAAAQATP